MIIKQYIDLAGKVRVYWKTATGEILKFKFSSQPTTEQLQALEQQHEELDQYADETPVNFNNLDIHIELIKELIVLIRNNPTVGLTAYNNYLNSKLWYEKDILRYFMYSLAVALAEKNEINITEYTEANVLLYIRNWIVNTDIRKIKQLILNIDLVL